jgi:UDP-N-acetylglucosamine acyltransferase
MRRRGVGRDAIRAVQQVYALLFEGEGEFAPRVDAVEAKLGSVTEVAKIIAFIREKRHRPIMLNRVRGRRDGDSD